MTVACNRVERGIAEFGYSVAVPGERVSWGEESIWRWLPRWIVGALPYIGSLLVLSLRVLAVGFVHAYRSNCRLGGRSAQRRVPWVYVGCPIGSGLRSRLQVGHVAMGIHRLPKRRA